MENFCFITNPIYITGPTNSFLPFQSAPQRNKNTPFQFWTAQLVSKGFAGLALSAQTSSPETRSKRVQFASSRLAINAGRIVNQMSWHARVEQEVTPETIWIKEREKETKLVHRETTYPHRPPVNQARINEMGHGFSEKLSR